MPGGFWMIIFHELELDTMPAEDIPDWVGDLPVWACILIPIALFAASILIELIPLLF